MSSKILNPSDESFHLYNYAEIKEDTKPTYTLNRTLIAIDDADIDYKVSFRGKTVIRHKPRSLTLKVRSEARSMESWRRPAEDQNFFGQSLYRYYHNCRRETRKCTRATSTAIERPSRSHNTGRCMWSGLRFGSLNKPAEFLAPAITDEMIDKTYGNDIVDALTVEDDVENFHKSTTSGKKRFILSGKLCFYTKSEFESVLEIDFGDYNFVLDDSLKTFFGFKNPTVLELQNCIEISEKFADGNEKHLKIVMK